MNITQSCCIGLFSYEICISEQILASAFKKLLPSDCFSNLDKRMQIADGIRGFKAARPRILMVSSGAVERNAIIGDDSGTPIGHSCLLSCLTMFLGKIVKKALSILMQRVTYM